MNMVYYACHSKWSGRVGKKGKLPDRLQTIKHERRMLMSISVEVWGSFACFSRPEMKVERVSYDMMTPSAARGLLDAIL